MRSIVKILIGTTNNVRLGRWSLKYDENVIQRVVSLANEDHCGCCEIKQSKEDEYYVPFVYNLLG